MTDRVKIEVSFEGEQVDVVLNALREAGAEIIPENRGLGMAGADVVLALLLIQAVTNLVIKLKQIFACGVIVDARGSQIRIRKDFNLPKGTVLIISSDGTQVKLHEPPDIQLDTLFKELKAKG